MKTIYFLYFIVAFNPLFSQNNFKKISNDESIQNIDKSKKFDILIKRYTNENKIDSLLTETYQILRWHFTNNNIEKAIQLNKKNLALMDSINYKDELFYRKNTYSLGFYQSQNKEKTKAINTLKSLLKSIETDKYSLNSTYEIAEIYFEQNDYYKALEYYKLCKLLSIKLKNDTMHTIATLGIGKSNLRINTQKSIKEAIYIVSNTIDYLEKSNKNNVDNYYIIQIYKLLGNLHSDRNDYNFETAIENFDKALKIAKKAGYTDEISFINNDIGLIYLKNKSPKAELFFNKALEYRTDNVMYGVIHRNLANHFIEIKNYNEALQKIQKSIEALNLKYTDSLTELPSKEKLKSSNFKNQLISSLIVKSNIWLKLAEINTNKNYYYEQAVKTIELGDWLIDIARLSDIEYKSKLYWRETATSLYLNAVEVYYKMNRPEDAFYYFEKNKAIQLLEDVNLKSLRENAQISSIISNKEKELKAKITALEKQIDSARTESLSRNLIIAKDNYDKFINSLDTEIRLLYKLDKPAEVITIKTLKESHLSSKQVYIEYILDNESGYGLLISKKESILFKIDQLDQLKDLSITYRNYLNTPITDKHALANFNKTAHSLYNILFPSNIKGLLDEKIITIIPDNYLQNIPFESLTTANNDTNSYLILKNEVNYAYSLTFLASNKALKKDNNNTILGFAPIDFKNNLSRLTNTESELKALNKLNSANIFLHEDASKDNFYNNSENAKVIHIASHANANDSISPWISFFDEKLHLNELYNHNTSADLVVLSACNTSLGELYKGEGVLSLARGFFNSGSQSVLTTLWTVNDKSTSFLMESFYENLKSGKSKSAALRNAKLHYLESHSLSEKSPYYWSSFILLGDANTIDLESGFSTLHYFILGFIILIAIFLAFRYKKK